MRKRSFCGTIALLLVLALLCCSAAAGEYAVSGISFRDGWDVRDQNLVFYEIFVGSFSDSDGDGTGDLRGIINRMDYLNDGDPASGKSLGVEGLWLTPIFLSPSYHKYDVTDFYTIDPAFGTMDDLRELVDLCHSRGVRVILDLPINHTSTENAWYKRFLNGHRMNNTSQTYYDFYTWLPVGETPPAGRHFARVFSPALLVEANFSDSMPELNFDNPLVREALLDVAAYYLDLGVDGFRFDAAKYIYLGDTPENLDFWDWYIGELKKLKPDLYTVAEVWDSDGITNQYARVLNCFNFTTSQVDGLISQTAQGGDVARYVAYLAQHQQELKAIRPDAMNLPFVANHDTDRAAGYLPVTNGRMQMAANLYLLAPGSPFIYYGEEIGLRGSRGGANTDANRRLAMRWGDGDAVRDPVGSTYDVSSQTPVQTMLTQSYSILSYYKKLLMIRRANPEIARGDITPLTLPGSKAGGFLCTWEGSSVAVLHNTTGKTVTVDLSQITDAPLTRLNGVIGLGTAELDGTLLTLEGQTSVVLR